MHETCNRVKTTVERKNLMINGPLWYIRSEILPTGMVNRFLTSRSVLYVQKDRCQGLYHVDLKKQWGPGCRVNCYYMYDSCFWHFKRPGAKAFARNSLRSPSNHMKALLSYDELNVCFARWQNIQSSYLVRKSHIDFVPWPKLKQTTGEI